MIRIRKLGVVAALLGLLVPATALALGLRSTRRIHTARRAAVPQAASTTGVPEIGALYPTSTTNQHDCTASVLNTAHGNTLITAAHCVQGRGAGMVFVPAAHNGRAPYGRWMVTAAYVGTGWDKRQDPREDVAFLTVAPRRIKGALTEIQQVTGAYSLGSTGRAGQHVTITGYPEGSTNDPITCTSTVYDTRAYPSFDCHGYVAGTSGSPWVRRTAKGPAIVGVIGGLNQGGCYEHTSYSSPLGSDVLIAYQRAGGGLAADTVPAPGSDGCA